jgi:hypothetical protein
MTQETKVSGFLCQGQMECCRLKVGHRASTTENGAIFFIGPHYLKHNLADFNFACCRDCKCFRIGLGSLAVRDFGQTRSPS